MSSRNFMKITFISRKRQSIIIGYSGHRVNVWTNTLIRAFLVHIDKEMCETMEFGPVGYRTGFRAWATS